MQKPRSIRRDSDQEQDKELEQRHAKSLADALMIRQVYLEIITRKDAKAIQGRRLA